MAATGLGVVAGIFALLSFGQHIAFGFPVPVEGFELNTEGNIPTWFQATNLLLAAGLTALIATARARASANDVTHWVVAAGALAYLSADEALALHERLTIQVDSLLQGNGAFTFDGTGIFTFGWVVPGLALVIVFAAVYVRFLLHLPGPLRALLLIAGTLYLGGALGMEMAQGAYRSAFSGSHHLGEALLTDVEETLEMLGQVVLVYALLRFLQELRVSVRVVERSADEQARQSRFDRVRSRWEGSAPDPDTADAPYTGTGEAARRARLPPQRAPEGPP
jgi:hypothetical protein